MVNTGIPAAPGACSAMQGGSPGEPRATFAEGHPSLCAADADLLLCSGRIQSHIRYLSRPLRVHEQI